MKRLISVLTITGSDSTSSSGIQADIQTITALGGHAMSAITSITSQTSQGIKDIFDLPAQVVMNQVQTIVKDMHPHAIKLGMIRNAELIKPLRDEIVGCPIIVSAPGLLSAHGERLMDDYTLAQYMHHLLPEVKVLVLKCSEAELMLNCRIDTLKDMAEAARKLMQFGPHAVMLRGGHCEEGLVTGLLLSADAPDHPQSFTSPNTEGWQLHGVSGTLSSAIATRMAMGDDIEKAIDNAHKYIRRQVVYSVDSASHSLRHVELYNHLLELIVSHHKNEHSVQFYASQLNVTTRYLADITARVAGKSPKQLIADYLIREVEQRLCTSSATVQEVAIEFGFTDQSAFTKFFRIQKGCSPSDFRR